VAALLAATGLSAAESAAGRCDRLAAEPGAVEGVAGVELAAIDAEAAIAACAAALEESPTDPRLAYQYARALERAGRLEEAQRLYGWAAADGYAPAAAALERLAAATAAPLALAPEAAVKAESLAGLAAVLRRYEASLPPDPADPLTVLAEVGGEPQALLDWVAANTRLVAYRGELRGAVGVLIDRSGNSLDRALLLAEFLRHGGYEVRLARATLAPEQARLLLPATLRTAPVPELPPLTTDEAVAFFEGEPRLDPAEVRQAAEVSEREQQQARARFDERLALVLPAVRDAVAPYAAGATHAEQAEMLAALADHFWVQLRTGAGWRDLDPEGAALGVVAPGETFELGKLPAELRQSVVLRVVLELQDSKGRREERLVEWQGFTAELLDRPLQLSHVPRTLSAVDLEWLIAQPDARERILAILDEEQGWMPLLSIGEQVLVDRLFTRDGRIAPANANAFAGTGASLGSLFDQADDVLGGGEAAAAAEPAVPTAEWLEIEVRVPGADPKVERRTIFDLVGPAMREAGTVAAFTDAQLRERAVRLLGSTQILLLGAAPSALQMEHVQAGELQARAERLGSMLAAGMIDLEALPMPPPGVPLTLLSFARDRMVAPVGRPRAVGSPTVVLLHKRIALTSDLTVATQMEVDIVRNEVTAPADSFATRLTQGVVDTVLEGLLLGEQPGLRNAAARHGADLAAGRPWTRIEAADLPRLAAAGLPADDRARLQADLAAGYIVIAPAGPEAATPGELAWWRIDPRNGTALGMLSSGGGATMVEWGAVMQTFLVSACGTAALGVAMAGGDASTRVVLLTGLGACAAVGPLGLVTAVPGLVVAGGAGVLGIAAAVLIYNVP